MIVRLMKDEDTKQVEKIAIKTFSRPWSRPGFLDAMRNKDTIYLVAEEKNEILGYLGLWKSMEEADITNVAVKENARRKGVAGLLLQEAKQIALKEGVMAFTLEVRVSNQAAIRLYEKHGFHSVGRRPGFYEDPKEDALIMWDNL